MSPNGQMSTVIDLSDERFVDSTTSFSVLEFYRHKSIFLTGCTGFVGKVLLEKLLRCCSIAKIYVLMRAKHNQTAAQRLEEMLNKSKLFNFNRDELDFSKVVPIAGDITEARLGISNQDRLLLANNVQVVFHSAASVQFTGEMKKFVQQNVRGTEAVMELAQEMKMLQSVVYVSTAYANCHLPEVEEKVYRVSPEPVESLIDKVLRSPDLMERPNCYTLSKAIAEELVEEKFSHLPVVICRPSIVTHAYQEPVDGWCDSMNGLAGALILGGLGIAQTMDVNCQFKSDIIPVDMVVNSLIVVGAYSATRQEAVPRVFHLTSGVQNPITWGQILDYARKATFDKPSCKIVRPIADNPVVAKSKWGRMRYHLTKIFSHYLFAIMLDLLLLVTGHDRFMVKITKRMHRAFEVLEHFTSREWCFNHKNYLSVFRSLSKEEQHLFQSDIAVVDWPQYCESINLGSRRYLLKEDDSTIEHARRRYKIINIIYAVFDVLFYIALFAMFVYFVLFSLFI